MGELYPPTSADYAWEAANDAQRENQRLKARIQKLEAFLGLEEPEPEPVKGKTAAEFLRDTYKTKVK